MPTNMMRTAVMLAAMTALFLIVGAMLGGRGGMMVAFAIAVATNVFAWWNSDRLALASTDAREVDAATAPDLVSLVGDLARRAQLPMPRVYMIDSDQPNAFATGRDPDHAAVAVNAALVHRLKTGEATKIDIAMFDCQIALLENAVMRYTVEGEIPGPLGARHPTITPFQAFKTADGAIIIAAGNDSLFVKMCGALGLDALAADPEYKTNALRQKHHRKLQHAIEHVLASHGTEHWIAVVGKAGVPCGPINNIEQALAHPQVAARNMLVTAPDGSGGTLKLAGNPLKMSAFADPPTRAAAPDLDADRDAILSFIGG